MAEDMTLKQYVDDHIPYSLRGFFQKYAHVIEAISTFLESQGNYTPRVPYIFSSLNMVSFDPEGLHPNSLRVVCVLQDVYHQPGLAHGVAMSTLDGSIPMTLRNVEKVLQKSYPEMKLKSGDIRGWCNQGVLLWNMALTTITGESGQHRGEWAIFNSMFMKYLSSTFPFLVFVLFGRDARCAKGDIDMSKHVVLETSHPVARHPHNTFLDGNIFKEINDALIENHRHPVDWEDIHYI